MSNKAPESHGVPASAKSASWAVALTAHTLIILMSLVISLLLAEAGFRIANGISLLDGTSWRTEGVNIKRIGDRAVYDPVLGWTLRPGYRSDDFNTIDLGIRRNFSESTIREGGILAVGDSFTEGFDEVDDAGTWPAHLEKILGLPVINGGVAGYATDQATLRAEQLLPTISPKTLIFGMTYLAVARAGLSEAGAPKPYFTTDDSGLVYHAAGPIDAESGETKVGSALRRVLGYSKLGDHLFSRLAPQFWYPQQASVYKEIDNDSLIVTCRLLERLKRDTDEKNVRLLLFLQYGGDIILEQPEISSDMRALTECAQKAGIQVADQFGPLKALTHGNRELVAQFYSVYGNEFGHMTSRGNQQAAELLAKALKSEPAPIDAALDKKEPLPN